VLRRNRTSSSLSPRTHFAEHSILFSPASITHRRFQHALHLFVIVHARAAHTGRSINTDDALMISRCRAIYCAVVGLSVYGSPPSPAQTGSFHALIYCDFHFAGTQISAHRVRKRIGRASTRMSSISARRRQYRRTDFPLHCAGEQARRRKLSHRARQTGRAPTINRRHTAQR
jgi:hypothetical protein